MGELLKDYPRWKNTRIYSNDGSKLIRKGNEYINEERGDADSTFFLYSPCPPSAGDTKNALNEPKRLW